MGFKIVIYYLEVADLTINLKRISQRVERGGHDISTPTVLRRSNRTVNNLIKIIEIMNEVYLVENTTINAEIDINNRRIDNLGEKIPKWGSFSLWGF